MARILTFTARNSISKLLRFVLIVFQAALRVVQNKIFSSANSLVDAGCNGCVLVVSNKIFNCHVIL